MSAKETASDKNQFLLINSTFIACESEKVIAYSTESQVQEFDDIGHNLGSIKILYTVNFPSPEEAHTGLHKPVAIFKSTENRMHAIIAWESCHFQLIDVHNGSTLDLYQCGSSSSLCRLVSVRQWHRDQYLLVTSNPSEDLYDASVWARTTKKIHNWGTLPSRDVDILFQSEANSNIGAEMLNAEPMPSGIVCVTSDRNGLQWYNIHENHTWQHFNLPLKSQAEIAWFSAHPKEPGLFAVTDTTGELFIIKGIGTVDYGTSIRYSAKRWHSRSIKAAHWHVDAHSFDKDTLFTGGDEGVLCIWSVRSLQLATIPRIPGAITAIIPSLTDPSQVMVRIGTSTLISLDITEKRVIAEYPYVSSIFEWQEYKSIKKVVFMGKECLCLFNSSRDEIRIVHASTLEILYNIPTSTHRNRVVSTNENSLFNTANQIIALEIVHHHALEIIVTYEYVPMLHQDDRATTVLRFFHFDTHEKTFNCGTVVHEPHTASSLDRACGSPQGISCPAIDAIMCAHPFIPIVFTGVKSEFKLWTVRKEEDLTGSFQISWFCFSIHFQGVQEARFTNDGGAIGVWEFPSNKFFLYDTEALLNDSLLIPLFSIELDILVNRYFWPKSISFTHDDSQCILIAEHHVYVLQILQRNLEARMLLDEAALVGSVLLDSQNSTLLVFASDNCLRIFDHDHECPTSDRLKCVFSEGWSLHSEDVHVCGGVAYFDTKFEGYLYVLFSKLNDSMKTHLKKFKFDTQGATLQPVEAELNTLFLRGEDKFHKTLMTDLPLVVKARDSGNALRVTDRGQGTKLDIDVALSSSSFKLPPLSILTRKLWEE